MLKRENSDANTELCQLRISQEIVVNERLAVEALLEDVRVKYAKCVDDQDKLVYELQIARIAGEESESRLNDVEMLTKKLQQSLENERELVQLRDMDEQRVQELQLRLSELSNVRVELDQKSTALVDLTSRLKFLNSENEQLTSQVESQTSLIGKISDERVVMNEKILALTDELLKREHSSIVSAEACKAQASDKSQLELETQLVRRRLQDIKESRVHTL